MVHCGQFKRCCSDHPSITRCIICKYRSCSSCFASLSLSCYVHVNSCSPNTGQQSGKARRAFEAHGGHSAHGNNGPWKAKPKAFLIMLIYVGHCWSMLTHTRTTCLEQCCCSRHSSFTIHSHSALSTVNVGTSTYCIF